MDHILQIQTTSGDLAAFPQWQVESVRELKNGHAVIRMPGKGEWTTQDTAATVWRWLSEVGWHSIGFEGLDGLEYRVGALAVRHVSPHSQGALIHCEGGDYITTKTYTDTIIDLDGQL